ncbi:MAG: protein kinase domain-containing protein, partial [Bryobacteraceae bacterium]
RFKREAQVLASLNHPNIAAIYGVEERALILELVEGPTLAERIGEGPVPTEEALPLVNQLIDALEYAHDKGIIHRDLKPANLKLTPEGRLKVLDFGLAKALTAESAAEASPASSPTLTMGATIAGVIMGTAAYMAPEQARGQNADRRADIWAFGTVVYELLSGKRLFEAPTVGDTLAAVLARDPDFSAVPARFHRLLRLCLARDPRERLSHISAARLLLDEPAAPTPAPARRALVPWMVAGALAVALAAILALPRHAPAPTNAPVLRFEADPGALAGLLAVSPDGSRVVYAASTDAGTQLMLRQLDQTQAVAMARIPRGSGPSALAATGAAFSPDGQWIAFAAGGKLKKIPLKGGVPIELCDAVVGSMGVSWGDDGYIAFAPNVRSPISRIPAAGGTPQAITHFDAGRHEITHRMPYFLPGGKTLLYTASSSGGMYDNADIVDLNLETGRGKVLHHGGFHPVYFGAPGGKGYLLFAREDTLYAMAMDAAALTAAEPPIPVLQGVATNRAFGGAMVDVARNGMLVYQAGGAADLGTVDLLDPAGGKRTILGTPASTTCLACLRTASASCTGTSPMTSRTCGSTTWKPTMRPG